MREDAKSKLDGISIHQITHMLRDFPFVGDTPYLDIYALFSVKPMYILHIGVPRMLKEADADSLPGTSHTTDHYRKIEPKTGPLRAYAQP